MAMFSDPRDNLKKQSSNIIGLNKEVKPKVPCLEQWGDNNFPGAKVTLSLKKHTGQSYLQDTFCCEARGEEKFDIVSSSAVSDMVGKSKG